MIINIKTLQEGVSCFNIAETAEKLGIDDIKDARFLGLVECTIEVDNKIESFTVRGRAKTSLETVCARCGIVVKRSINADFDHKYVKGNFEEDGQIDKEALDEELLQGDELNLLEDVRQAVLISVSEIAVCNEKCKGICPGCGKNLNKAECSCEAEDLKPFANLKKLLKEKKNK
ncbi:MAG: hypothetical protein A2452_08275 [Candidatus Firestonebacteria bacterium RIFOXYC2_FULL_39_67]|nr:MAG: hypothetical protein A2536_05005 [Candidatus Firestonebacteria bacterium RIFOXYD2_FULL_39_29]OGF53755.1 MAG: hypothetical protein A2452_08275 [Candidatus Firestonebacteria bacterium RIFOXYC2_FULL_39_67]OGF57997.1 MAG: hypothetical protein A2497_04370 [Candidatus Firestonebacteria bacterium RifOxyC12_full_39_7]